MVEHASTSFQASRGAAARTRPWHPPRFRSLSQPSPTPCIGTLHASPRLHASTSRAALLLLAQQRCALCSAWQGFVPLKFCPAPRPPRAVVCRLQRPATSLSQRRLGLTACIRCLSRGVWVVGGGMHLPLRERAAARWTANCSVPHVVGSLAGRGVVLHCWAFLLGCVGGCMGFVSLGHLWDISSGHEWC